MTGTYCGKSCAECAYMESNECRGCKSGPGSRLNGGCEIASCCRDKGHEACDTCGHKGSCGLFMGRVDKFQDIKRRNEEIMTEKTALSERSLFLGKWIHILFVISLTSVIAGLFKVDKTYHYDLYFAGECIGEAFGIAIALILLKLSVAEEKYRTSGICGMISGAAGITGLMISRSGETALWTLLITLPAAVIGLVGEYYEFKAHSSALLGVDYALSEKWDALWKWYMWSMILTIVGVVMAVIPVIGVLVAFTGMIGMIVVSIVKLVYLNKTANAFKYYLAQNG